MMVNIMRKTNDASHMNDMYRSNDGLKKSDLKQIIILRQIKWSSARYLMLNSLKTKLFIMPKWAGLHQLCVI